MGKVSSLSCDIQYFKGINPSEHCFSSGFFQIEIEWMLGGLECTFIKVLWLVILDGHSNYMKYQLKFYAW